MAIFRSFNKIVFVYSLFVRLLITHSNIQLGTRANHSSSIKKKLSLFVIQILRRSFFSRTPTPDAHPRTVFASGSIFTVMTTYLQSDCIAPHPSERAHLCTLTCAENSQLNPLPRTTAPHQIWSTIPSCCLNASNSTHIKNHNCVAVPNHWTRRLTFVAASKWLRTHKSTNVCMYFWTYWLFLHRSLVCWKLLAFLSRIIVACFFRRLIPFFSRSNIHKMVLKLFKVIGKEKKRELNCWT